MPCQILAESFLRRIDRVWNERPNHNNPIVFPITDVLFMAYFCGMVEHDTPQILALSTFSFSGKPASLFVECTETTSPPNELIHVLS